MTRHRVTQSCTYRRHYCTGYIAVCVVCVCECECVCVGVRVCECGCVCVCGCEQKPSSSLRQSSQESVAHVTSQLSCIHAEPQSSCACIRHSAYDRLELITSHSPHCETSTVSDNQFLRRCTTVLKNACSSDNIFFKH